MRKRLVLGTAGVALLALTGSVALAQNWPGCPWGVGPGVRPGLTEDQQKKGDALRVEHQQKRQGDLAALRQKSFELRTLTAVADPDAAKSKALQEEITALQEKLTQARLEHQTAVRNVLTEEQKAALGTAACPYGGPGLGFGRGRGAGLGYGAGRGPRRGGWGRGWCRNW